ncbi:MAG: PhnA domain-containing protein [Crocinitomicaceae bacterium]
MTKQLELRSNGVCELCAAQEELKSFTVSPKSGDNSNDCIAICATCNDQLTGKEDVVTNHWRCLNDSMWSEVEAVKVVAYRMLTQLKTEGWPNDLLEMMYLDEDTLEWAKTGMVDPEAKKHMDSNGVELLAGDSIVLIKDLKVKGGGFTAKRGTAVRNIRLVHDNPEQIEGKVEGQTIVILTEYVKK